jgi:hypothetical protein
MKKLVLALFLITLFCNFGGVEYSALHPQAKTITLDSTSKLSMQTPTKVVKEAEASAEAEIKEEGRSLLTYLVAGLHVLFASLVKMLIA